MEPNERHIVDEVGSPVWESDPRVHRALSDALVPPTDGALESRVALGRLWDRIGTPTNDRKIRFGLGPWQRRSAELGKQPLRRWLWPLGSIAMLVAAFFIVRLGSSRVSGTTRSYATGVNQQGILTLDDGTRVTLAPQTTVRLLGFSKHVRTVSVDGEAYFEVVHATGAPFNVRSGSVTTRVLGTAFLVHHAPNSSHVRVAVAEGKVHISDTSRVAADFILTAGHIGEITDSVTTVNAVEEPAPATEWLRGQLVFHHMPVAAVLQTLSRWYGYQILCADSTLPQRPVTISVSVRSLSSALTTLGQVLGVNLNVTGDTIMLTPQVDRGTRGMPRVRSYDIWTPVREAGR